jgi:SAM-dependent methyltransferase
MRYFGLGGPILEVGSGHRPYPHSDVLVDKHLEDREREGTLRRDGRPLIVCDLANLPFRDRVFAYVIAAHVLEHVEAPLVAARELERVARAGYIETPSALMEFVEPHRAYHRWSVRREDGSLIFVPKNPASTQFRQRMTNRLITANFGWKLFAHTNPQLFKTTLEWRGHIPLQVDQRALHPDDDLAAVPQGAGAFGRALLRKAGGLLIRRVLSALRPRRRVRLEALLRCPRCHGAVTVAPDRVRCAACTGGYPRDGELYFLSDARFEAGS